MAQGGIDTAGESASVEVPVPKRDRSEQGPHYWGQSHDLDVHDAPDVQFQCIGRLCCVLALTVHAHRDSREEKQKRPGGDGCTRWHAAGLGRESGAYLALVASAAAVGAAVIPALRRGRHAPGRTRSEPTSGGDGQSWFL